MVKAEPSSSNRPRRRYAKPSGFYFEARAEFFTENESLHKKAHEANEIYTRQPARKECKI